MLQTSQTSDRREGFTLLEILVVILIITVLATLVGVQVAGHPGEARITAARAQIGSIETALDLYRMQNGFYPTQRQGLVALIEKPTMDPVPTKYPQLGYLKKASQLTDPWGNEYVYLVPARRGRQPYEVISYGSDGEPGGEDEAADITSADL